MKVLFISNDPKIFDATSAVRGRMREYATLFDELHVVSRVPKYNTKEIREGNLCLHPVFGFLSLYKCALRIVHERSVDIVSAQDPFEYGLIALFARGKAKLHIQLHTDMFSPYFWWNPWWNILRFWVARFVFAHADGIRTLTERLKEMIHAKYCPRAPISVLPIFTDIEKYRRLPRMKHPRWKISLLVVSRLEKEKNVELAVRALKATRHAGHDAGLTIVGDGSEHENLRTLARSLGLERFVEFVGWQSDIAPHLSVADLLLFPSHYDGYGLSIIEALAAGVPVLATDVGVAREAGAMVVSKKEFLGALVRWCESGPRHGELQDYPYANEEEYLRKFGEDLELCAK